MSSFKESEVPLVPIVLLGGPLDGARFKMPLVPPTMAAPDQVSIPLKQPAETSPMAIYFRQGDEQVANYYLFIFEDCVGPGGEKLLFASPEISEPLVIAAEKPAAGTLILRN